MAALHRFKHSKNIVYQWQSLYILHFEKAHNCHLGDEYFSRGAGIEQDDAIFFLYL